MSTIMRATVDHVNQSPTADESVFEALHRVMHKVRAQRQRALSDLDAQVTPMEARALGFFARHPDATLTDLVAHSGRDKSQLARQIASLRERGLLEGRPDEADRRNLRLRCTAAAQELHRSLTLQMRRLERRALADFSPQERAQLADLLERLGGGLD